MESEQGKGDGDESDSDPEGDEDEGKKKKKKVGFRDRRVSHKLGHSFHWLSTVMKQILSELDKCCFLQSTVKQIFYFNFVSVCLVCCLVLYCSLHIKLLCTIFLMICYCHGLHFRKSILLVRGTKYIIKIMKSRHRQTMKIQHVRHSCRSLAMRIESAPTPPPTRSSVISPH